MSARTFHVEPNCFAGYQRRPPFLGPLPPGLPALLSDPNMALARASIPDADLGLVRGTYEQTTGAALSIEEAQDIILSIWFNPPICDACWKKQKPDGPHIDFYWCAGCSCASYCSRTCQKYEWARHSLRCQKRDGPLDDGPRAFAVVKMDPPVN